MIIRDSMRPDMLFRLNDRPEICGRLERTSPLYYTRLESDRACSLSMGACWRRVLDIPAKLQENQLKYRKNSWHDPYHGSCLIHSERRFASWTWLAANFAPDNRFYEKVGRFPAIVEDEAPLYLLCNEYP